MEFVDTHCHIQSSADQGPAEAGEEVTRDRWQRAGFPSAEDILSRAAQQHVNKMICVGCTLSDSRLAIAFAEAHPECSASIGIHPHEAQEYILPSGELNSELLDEFTVLASSDKVVAVGECGLDYYYEHSDRASQAQILKYQMELAIRRNLPMIFHVREAFDDFWQIFDEVVAGYSATAVGDEEGLRGVVHSFTDNQANLDKALSRGLYIGVNGIATFAKADAQLEMYRKIPIEKLLLETDSPFLTPHPYRGNICEPYHISVTANFLAGLRHEPLAELATATSSNAQTLFHI